MVIAINPDYGSVIIDPDYGPNGDRSSPRWAELLLRADHEVRWVDVYKADILEQLAGCDGFMWRHAHHSGMWHIARRLLPVLERELKLAVYPDQTTCWHYDDKIAQTYLFQALGVPTPRNWVWFDRDAAHAWAQEAEYPMVLKLWSGAQSAFVRLVTSRDEAARWIARLFSDGVYDLSDRSVCRLGWRRRVRVAVTAALLGRTMAPPELGWDLHKNYVYFQEFIPGNDWDTRITVIGNRAFGFRRMNRANDFRASGSGHSDWDPKCVDVESVKLGFWVARRLRTQSIALDILRRGNERVVTEISYTYASWGVQRCPGHWELEGDPATGTLVWCGGRMWPEEAQVADFLERLEQRKAADGATTSASLSEHAEHSR